jgi:hypothetical protein
LATASISSVWPFQRVRRPGSMTTGNPSGRRHSRASLTWRSTDTRAGSNFARSMPRWITRTIAGEAAYCSITWRAINCEIATTRTPLAMIEL